MTPLPTPGSMAPSASEYPTYVSALKTRTGYRSSAWLKYIGLTLDDIDGIIESVRTSLDRQVLTREALRGLADEIVEVEIEGHVAWMLAKDATQVQKTKVAETVRLLPNFDCYVLNFRPREHLVPTRFAARIFRSQGWISPVLLINGIAAGTWELERTGKQIEVRLQPFAPLRQIYMRRIEEEADRLGEFLQGGIRVFV